MSSIQLKFINDVGPNIIRSIDVLYKKNFIPFYRQGIIKKIMELITF